MDILIEKLVEDGGFLIHGGQRREQHNIARTHRNMFRAQCWKLERNLSGDFSTCENAVGA